MITHAVLAQMLWKIRLLALLVPLAFAGAAAVPDAERSSVRHPNLLLTPAEIEQIKVKEWPDAGK